MINVTSKCVGEVLEALEGIEDVFEKFGKWLNAQQFSHNERIVANTFFEVRFASVSGRRMMEANLARHSIGEARADEIAGQVKAFALDNDLCSEEEFDE